MKTIFLFVLILGSCISMNAQTFFIDQPLEFNPSMAGSANVSRVNLTGRVTSPYAFALSFDTYIGVLRGGVGIIASNGPVHTSSTLIYSPKFTARKTFTVAPSFGIGLTNSYNALSSRLKAAILINTKKAFFGISAQHDPTDKPYGILKSHIAFQHEFNDNFSLSSIVQSGYTYSKPKGSEYMTYDPEHGFIGGDEYGFYITQNSILGSIQSKIIKYQVYNHQLGLRLKYRKWKLGGGTSYTTRRILRTRKENWDSEGYFSSFFSTGYETEQVGIYLIGSNKSRYRKQGLNAPTASAILSLIYKFKK